MVPKLVNYVDIQERIENKGISQMTQSCPAIGIGTIGPIPADRLGLIMRICYWPAPILATPHVSPVAIAESRVALRGPAWFLMVCLEGLEPPTPRIETSWRSAGSLRRRWSGFFIYARMNPIF